MKIKSSKYKAHISVNARGTGAGIVIQQGQHRILLSAHEWTELRKAADAIVATTSGRAEQITGGH